MENKTWSMFMEDSLARNDRKEGDPKKISVTNEKEKTLIDELYGYSLSGIRHPNGTFIWDTTGTKVVMEKNWEIGEPSNSFYKEHCLELKFGDDEYVWNDYPCDERRKYMSN
ncbi:hypothetical protein GWI33_022566 [Rhynchophorus ferrugineus]|uniref:C-type lectin domain-containing protein n=1 Tax=Rhynchophorus ferrugineus TaxID=354439 RepID=A0A834ISG7_RHYFE|nr:hypothetical protein GWI33_022566 [Rhynchophorus ferrugineus]